MKPLCCYSKSDNHPTSEMAKKYWSRSIVWDCKVYKPSKISQWDISVKLMSIFYLQCQSLISTQPEFILYSFLLTAYIFCYPSTLTSITASTVSRYSYKHNTAYKLHFLPAKECYHYKDSNYVIQNCLVKLDMWQLIIEQWEKLIEDLNILRILRFDSIWN